MYIYILYILFHVLGLKRSWVVVGGVLCMGWSQHALLSDKQGLSSPGTARRKGNQEMEKKD